MHPKSSFAVARPSWRALQALALASILLSAIVAYVAAWGKSGIREAFHSSTIPNVQHVPNVVASNAATDEDEVLQGHPIEHLMNTATKRFDAMLQDEATSLEDAAKKYRSKRGRHPPPGFDAWYAYAKENGALVIESFFDQIYEDLGPFWGTDLHNLQRTVRAYSTKITIRSGVVDSKMKASHKRLQQAVSMLQSLAEHSHAVLPDVDIPLNINEEAAMLTPWEKVDTAWSLARPLTPSPSDVIDNFTTLDDKLYSKLKFDPEWLGGRLRHTTAKWFGVRPFWSLVQPACPPKTSGRVEPLLADIWNRDGHTKVEHSSTAILPQEHPEGSLQGFVKNWTTAIDACRFPYLQGLHGAFVAPQSMSVTEKLFPLLSSTKLAMSNEILIPSLSGWNSSRHIRSSLTPWSDRQNTLFWRGSASGGANAPNNWRRFHRHRFVSMLNATHVEIAEALLHAGNETMVGVGYASNFRLPPANPYHLATQRAGSMAEWVNSWADVGFTDLHCSEPSENSTCPYTEEYFTVVPSPIADIDQQYRYTAILDGTGGDDGDDFLHSLASGITTLKATIYRQWYDNRLVPWLHFVPMDNTFIDLYGIMEYFVGTGTKKGADEFSHAHVELPKHEHHFQTPHGDEEAEDSEEHQHAPPDGEHDDASEHHATTTRQRRDDNIIAGHTQEAQKIAEASQKWAEKVLRKEDALIYMYRLLLEYARVIDSRRERLGWVEDLAAEPGS